MAGAVRGTRIAGREAFMWPRGESPHHLYVVVAGSEPHRDHVDLRDYLRDHREVARKYASLKKRLAQQHEGDRLSYTTSAGQFSENDAE
jgi:GrpB-like predicted nucleotidyltransferase (UPF0157 family)